YWPVPNGPEDRDANGLLTGTSRALGNPVRARDEDFGLVRFDFNPSSVDSFSVNYTADEGREIDLEDNTNFRGYQTRDLYTLSIQETHIVSPTIVNTAMFGASRAGAVDQSVPVTPIPDPLRLLRDEKRESPGANSIWRAASTAGAQALAPASAQDPLD